MAEISKIKTIDGTTYDVKDTVARTNYVAKNGDTMTGGLRAPYFYSTDNGSTGYNGLSFTSGTNAVKARIRYAQVGTTSSHLVFGQDSADGTKYAEFSLPEITDNADYAILTTKDAVSIAQGGTGATTASGARNNLGAMSVTPTCIELMPGSGSAGHGGYIDFHYNNSSADYTSRILETNGQLEFVVSNGAKFTTSKGAADGTTFAAALVLAQTTATIANGSYLYGNGIYAPNMAAGSFALGIIVGQSASAGNCGYLGFKYAGNNNEGNFVSLGLHSTDHAFKVWKSGDIESTGDLYVNGGDIILKSNYYPFISLRNGSNKELAGVWTDQGSRRIYLREFGSAGGSYYTDIVFPAAKTNATENVYVYTSRNFSLSGTTLTITVPS